MEDSFHVLLARFSSCRLDTIRFVTVGKCSGILDQKQGAYGEETIVKSSMPDYMHFEIIHPVCAYEVA